MTTDIKTPEKNERLSYLLDMYKIYTSHINTMLNYFLIIAGLIASAFTQSIQKQSGVSWKLSCLIAAFGMALSLISLLIHVRSRSLLDTIETGLAAEERIMFSDGAGFLAAPFRQSRWYLRHKYQFRMIYGLFIILFTVMAIYCAWEPFFEVFPAVKTCLGMS